MWAALCSIALTKGRCLEVSTAGTTQLVEVHAVGTTHEGRQVVRAWHVSGGEPAGWVLLRIDAITAAKVSARLSQAPRPGYERDEPVMMAVHRQL